jgi:hypothetical protein
MLQRGVGAIVVLGGDGTHRAVVRELVAAGSRVPLAGLSTGTNNAFPEMREPTITGMAAALVAAGRVMPPWRWRPTSCSRSTSPVPVAGSARHRHRRRRGHARPHRRRARAVEAAVAGRGLPGLAEPGAIGLSSIGGLLQPVGRHERGGLAVQIAHNGAPALTTLHAPIAPGLVLPVPLAGWQRMAADEPLPVLLRAGTVALDGERELAFDEGDRVTATLREHAFLTVDVARCMATAAHEGLLAPRPLTP